MNNYDLQMGLTAIGPIGFIVGLGICVLIGWLIKR